MPSKLIGFNDSAKRVADEVAERLLSIKPYEGFSITGARRSGRSSFFTQVARLINSRDEPSINCFVSELAESTRSGFENALLSSIKSSGLCSGDYSGFKDKVRTPDGFFLLCETLYRQEIKVPVFFIDMGRALDEGFKERGFEGVRDLGMLLRNVVNLAEERNDSIILGIGLTLQFVDYANDAARDTWIDRYRPIISLSNNTYEGEGPGDSFRKIVGEISGLLIPDRYRGLWRGTAVTAGQLGENLKSSKVSEITSASLWQNLRGQWEMIREVSLDDMPLVDLGELILADAVIPDNRYPEHLEQCEEGFRATDRLYEHFGFFSSRRDPSRSERIKRRVEDPEDDDVVCDILLGVGKSLESLGLHAISSPEVLGQKSAWMEAQVHDFPGPDLAELEKDLFKATLPRKLVVFAFLTADGDEDAAIEKLRNSAAQGCFILVLYREGIDLTRIPLGRHIEKDVPFASSQPLSHDAIVSLLDILMGGLYEDVEGWVNDAVAKLFKKKPPLCVNNNIIKQLISGTISYGRLQIDKFAEQKGISKSETNKYLNLLLEPQILEKRKGIVIWDPANDVILSAILKHKGNKEKISADISDLFTIARVDVEELASLYQCISADRGLEGLTRDGILLHSKQLQNYHLGVIRKHLDALRNKSNAYDELVAKYETYRSRDLSEISDVAPYQIDIHKLIEETEQEALTIEEREKQNQQELADKKASSKKELEDYADYFRPEEAKQFLEKIEGIRSVTSLSFDQVAKSIRNRKKQVDQLREYRKKSENRLNKLQTNPQAVGYEEIKYALDRMQKLIEQLRMDEIEKMEDSVDKGLRDLEELAEQREVIARVSASSGSIPPVSFVPPSAETRTGPPKLVSPPIIPKPRTAGSASSGNSVAPPTPESENAPPKEMTFDLLDPEERRTLAKVLINHAGDINKIKIEVSD